VCMSILATEAGQERGSNSVVPWLQEQNKSTKPMEQQVSVFWEQVSCNMFTSNAIARGSSAI
jgi:hypothetical protein